MQALSLVSPIFRWHVIGLWVCLAGGFASAILAQDAQPIQGSVADSASDSTASRPALAAVAGAPALADSLALVVQRALLPALSEIAITSEQRQAMADV